MALLPRRGVALWRRHSPSSRLKKVVGIDVHLDGKLIRLALILKAPADFRSWPDSDPSLIGASRPEADMATSKLNHRKAAAHRSA
jgi:hypothetical protein